MESQIIAKTATSASILNKGYQFLSLNYWFTTPEPRSLAAFYPFEIISILVLIVSLLILGLRLQRKNLTPPQQKFLTSAFFFLIWFGPIGWLLIFFRSQGVVFLSARFWWIVWITCLLGVILYLFRYYRGKLGYSIRQYQAYQLKKKYLPTKKKR